MNTKLNKLAKPSLAAVALAAVSVGVAVPAHASTTKDGCTVSPIAAEFRGTYDPSNTPYVYYSYDVTCGASASGLSVEVSTTTYDQDLAGRAGDVDWNGVNNADEDLVGTATTTRSFGTAGGTKHVDVRGTLPRTDTDFNEEMYQALKFRVTSGPVTGGWSKLELTTPTQIWW